MQWLAGTELEEFLADPLVERLRECLEEDHRQALKRLRVVSRAGSLDEIRGAEAKVSTLEAVLLYITEAESSEEKT